MQDQVIVHQGTFRKEQEKSYIHLPFDMPPGATQLKVEHTYSNRIGSNPLLNGGNTLDLGVFDARGIDFIKAGFRGWSGSERSSFCIDLNEATPGYVPGPLLPGRWHVYLGLYKIAPEGCAYEVKISISTGNGAVGQAAPVLAPPEPVRAFSRNGDLPFSRPRGLLAPWLCGELHCHSWHSDGDSSATALVQLARERGLDFVAVSDHNTTASQRELAELHDPGLILIRGIEVTTYKGHFNVWGVEDWIEFRVGSPQDMRAALQFAQARGAVTSCGHPKPFGPDWDYESVTDYHCVEVWNGPWTLLNQMALEFWTKQLQTGRRIPAIGGSDYHNRSHLAEVPLRAPGAPAVWVYVPGEPTSAAVLQAIRDGHVSLSPDIGGPFIDLRAGEESSAMGGDILQLPANGKLAVQVRCRNAGGHRLVLLDQETELYGNRVSSDDAVVSTEVLAQDSLYVRAELRTAEQDLVAMTNPIYLQPKGRAGF